jgi:hypothetical protein
MKSLVLLLVAGLLTSCGVVGAPVAPESVGVAVTIEQQKKRDALDAQQRKAAAEAEESDQTLEGQDVNLPPERPEETR